MYQALNEWIVIPNIGEINIAKYLSDDDSMARVSNRFYLRSDGLLVGAIGTLDGWLVRIRRPLRFWDKIFNPVSFFSRKGLYVQYLVDHEKKVLRASYSHKGASHDSTFFHDTKLYELLKKIQDKLFMIK